MTTLLEFDTLKYLIFSRESTKIRNGYIRTRFMPDYKVYDGNKLKLKGGWVYDKYIQCSDECDFLFSQNLYYKGNCILKIKHNKLVGIIDINDAYIEYIHERFMYYYSYVFFTLLGVYVSVIGGMRLIEICCY